MRLRLEQLSLGLLWAPVGLLVTTAMEAAMEGATMDGTIVLQVVSPDRVDSVVAHALDLVAVTRLIHTRLFQDQLFAVRDLHDHDLIILIALAHSLTCHVTVLDEIVTCACI